MKQQTVRVVPAPLLVDGAPAQRLVHNPDNAGLPLPPEGADVEVSTYWRRRIARGEVEVRGVAGDAESPEPPARAERKPRS